VRLSSFPASGAYAARWSAAHSLGWTESEYLQDAVSNPRWRSRNVDAGDAARVYRSGWCESRLL